jgi:predicted ATPase/DNA-binding SARP family transcriptional activator
VEFRILGSLVVLDERGEEVALKGARLRTLLGLLIVRAGHVVAADQIAEALWGDSPPSESTGALHNQISRLRAALKVAGADCIETRPPGYTLQVDLASIDAFKFEDAARAGRALLDADEPAKANDVLTAALALWRGDVLADVDDTELARGERARWTELRRVAEEDRADAELACGRHREIVGELEAMVAAEPLRERRTAQLMLALYRSGRQADALRAFQTTRAHLADELGIDPGPELRALEAAVLDQDASLGAGDACPAARPSSRKHLPAPISRCIGRQDALDDLDARLQDARLVTLTGPGGVGKTALALEAGRRCEARFDDGAVLVELASVQAPEAVVAAAARALGLDELRGPSRPAELLAQLLADRELLVVLDNCEHVLDAAADLAITLLGRGPALTIIATSRQALGLTGEVNFAVPVLAPDAAAQLFSERAAAVVNGFALDDSNGASVSDICARLDGIPLAIELAASRTRVFSVAQLAKRLDDRFRTLTGGARGALPRHQTLRAIVDWSYDLLDPAEQHVFARLSVFAGGASVEAAEAVAGDIDVVQQLVEKSLVASMVGPTGTRFTMLQTLTEYAYDRLVENGESDATFARLTDWLVEQTRGASEARPLSFALEFARELDNARLALAWAGEHDVSRAVDLATALGWFWTFVDARADGFRTLSQIVRSDVELSDSQRVRVLMWAAHLASTPDEMTEGAVWGDAAVEAARRLADPQMLGRAALLRAEQLSRADVSRAQPLFDEARTCFDAADDWFWTGYLDYAEGIAASVRGELETAYELSRRAVETFRSHDDEAMLIFSLERLGEAADAYGRHEEAIALLEEALARDGGLPGAGRRASMLTRLARAHVHAGHADEGLAIAKDALAVAQTQTWGLLTGMAFFARGLALRELGRRDEAILDYEAGLAALTSAGMDSIAALLRPQLDELLAQRD